MKALESPALTFHEAGLPSHIAIIPDGNRRWARKNKRPKVYGYLRGARRALSVIEEASRCGIKALTIFALSTENLSRSISEVSLVVKICELFLKRQVKNWHRNNIRFRCIGQLEMIDQP